MMKLIKPYNPPYISRFWIVDYNDQVVDGICNKYVKWCEENIDGSEIHDQYVDWYVSILKPIIYFAKKQDAVWFMMANDNSSINSF